MWPTTFVVCTYIWHSFNSKSIFKKAGISCLNFFFHLHLPPKKSVKRIEIVWTLELLTDKISRFLSYDRPSSQNNIWTTWICDRKWRVLNIFQCVLWSLKRNSGTWQRQSFTNKRQGTKAMANYSWPTENGQWPLGLPYWPSDQGLVQRLIRGLPNPEITSIACKSWLNLHMYSWW